MSEVHVLFVCLGNICRSPTATGVLRELVRREGLSHRVTVAGAGTQGYHAGEPPDPRTRRAALVRGYDLSDLRARQVTADQIARARYVLAMDESNLTALGRIARPEDRPRLARFLDFAPHLALRDVPDPWSGGPEQFEQVLDLCEEAARGLLAHLRAHDLT